MHGRQEISLDQKLRYLREIENIHRLSKKVLPPRGTTWARIADGHPKRALGMPVREQAEALNITRGQYKHMHSPRTARVVERTLRNGVIHPDFLHSYRGDNVQTVREDPLVFHDKPQMTADTPDVIHIVHHGATDLEYPEGHLQGFWFVSRTHDVASHVPLEQAGEADAVVPTSAKGSYS